MEIVYKEEEKIDKKKDNTKELPWCRCRGFNSHPSISFILVNYGIKSHLFWVVVGENLLFATG